MFDYSDQPWDQNQNDEENSTHCHEISKEVAVSSEESPAAQSRAKLSGRPPGRSNKVWITVEEGPNVGRLREEATRRGCYSYNKGDKAHDIHFLSRCKHHNCPLRCGS